MSKMNIERKKFGTAKDGRQVDAFVLENSNGIQVTLITWGASIQSLMLPDKTGKAEEVTLGFDSLEKYEGEHPFFGSLVGRYANRIKGAKFSLDGKEYSLAANDGKNSLHGGPCGFHHVIWEGFPIKKDDSVSVKFVYASPDGEEGFPGNCDVSAVYTLNDRNELIMDWEAVSDKATPINLTNHAYWNLSGRKCSILDHMLEVNAGSYLPMDSTSIPTGEICSVEGGGMDFTSPRPVGSKLEHIDHNGAGEYGGYDHCYVLNGKDGELKKAAVLTDPESGRCMKVYATQPAIHIYTGNYLGRFESRLGKHKAQDAICLETEHFPDSPNQANFPDCILRPGKTYSQKVIHRFIF